jgi:hypothetical protein
MRSQTVVLADQQREIINGAANMEDHETRPEGHSSVDVQTTLNKTGRGFAKKTVEQNEFHASRRDPYERVMGWLSPRTGR